MTQATLRRARTQVTPVDVSHFRPMVEQAMEAFQADVSYAVHIARAAVSIVNKRQVWQARRDARAET